jgi:hypothetical protein
MLPPVNAHDLPRIAEPQVRRKAVRRVQRAVRGNVGAALLMAQRDHRQQRSWLLIGDSHAVHLVDGEMPSPQVLRADRSTSVVYLGPRLMHSFARDGVPTWARRLLAARMRSPLASTEVTAVLALGEIDVRCHLAKPGRGDDANLHELVRGYVQRAVELLGELGPDGRVVVLSPNPPSEEYDSSQTGYPVVGSAQERAGILDRLCAALAAEVQSRRDPRLRFLDLRPAVADGDGLLRSDLTFDGCHLNAAGSAIARRLLSELDAAGS